MATYGDIVWEFCTANFAVTLEVAPECEPYDGDDEDGEIQAKIDSGVYEWFSASVCVYLRSDVTFNSECMLISADRLGMCCYESFAEFYTSHRCSDPMNRNCSIMRAACGQNVAICHYFPGMVHEAIAAARKAMAGVPRLRAA